MDNIISLNHVTKRYDSFTAVNDLNWELEAGQIYGLLGPNGAGKTTTIRMLLRIILPDEGEITAFGHPLSEHTQHRIGYLPEERGLYRKMTVESLLLFFAGIRGITRKDARQQAYYWLERFDLDGWAKKQVQELSRGMQQKIQFIITLLHRPSILILDEPFQGLDPVNTDLLKDIILERKKQGITVLLSTHIMEQAEKLCDNICLIDKSKKIIDGSLSGIKKEWGKNTVIIGYEDNGEYFHQHPSVLHYNDYGKSIEVELKPKVDPVQFLSEAVRQVRINHFEVKAPSLHEIFVSLVSQQSEGIQK